MAVSTETQRLISVSLGKIAQSRGQRGGINLHKNLLVATVLHKARTAYMMESYNYQQNLHRQKLFQQYQLQQQQHGPPGQTGTESSPLGESNKGDVGPLTRDSNLGHATPKSGEQQTRSEVSSYNGPAHVSQELPPVHDGKAAAVNDKENAPPCLDSVCVLTEHVPVVTPSVSPSPDSHLTAAMQLSREVQMAASEQSANKQNNTANPGTTCSVLKRRKDNSSSSHEECSYNKIARFGYDNDCHGQSSPPGKDYSDSSRHESHSQPDTAHSSDFSEHHQISNLVGIFNSGFSGLCVTSSTELHSSTYPSDFVDISNSLTRNITVMAG